VPNSATFWRTPSVAKRVLFSLPKKNFYLIYINIYGTRLVSLDRYLNLFFIKFISRHKCCTYFLQIRSNLWHENTQRHSFGDGDSTNKVQWRIIINYSYHGMMVVQNTISHWWVMSILLCAYRYAQLRNFKRKILWKHEHDLIFIFGIHIFCPCIYFPVRLCKPEEFSRSEKKFELSTRYAQPHTIDERTYVKGRTREKTASGNVIIILTAWKRITGM
jgi:hypothetical protein